jgi:hypothetical protein
MKTLHAPFISDDDQRQDEGGLFREQGAKIKKARPGQAGNSLGAVVPVGIQIEYKRAYNEQHRQQAGPVGDGRHAFGLQGMHAVDQGAEKSRGLVLGYLKQEKIEHDGGQKVDDQVGEVVAEGLEFP